MSAKSSRARVALSEPCVAPSRWPPLFGREFDLDLLEAFADIPENDLLDAIDEAAGRSSSTRRVGKPGPLFVPSRAHPRRALRQHGVDEARAGSIGALPSARKVERRLRPSRRSPDLAYHFAQAASAASPIVRPTTPPAPAIAWPRRSPTRKRRASTTMRCRRSIRCRPGPRSSVSASSIHRRRGRAFGNLGQWGQQRAALEAKRSQHVQHGYRRKSAARSSPISSQAPSGCSISPRSNGCRPKR